MLACDRGRPAVKRLNKRLRQLLGVVARVPYDDDRVGLIATVGRPHRFRVDPDEIWGAGKRECRAGQRDSVSEVVESVAVGIAVGAATILNWTSYFFLSTVKKK